MRVKIWLHPMHVRSTRVRDALRIAFGLSNAECDAIEHVSGRFIECTAEQFTLFIVTRNILGGSNSIKDLKPEIMDSAQSTLDVTKRKQK